MNNPHKMRTGMDRVLHAFGYSMQGLRAALRFESAFRQEAALALVLLPAAFWLFGTGLLGLLGIRRRMAAG